MNNQPIIDLNKLRAVVSRSERYGLVDGIDGTQPADIIAAELAKTRGSVGEAGRALLALYSDFGADAVNDALSPPAGKIRTPSLAIDDNMSKVIAATSANPL